MNMKEHTCCFTGHRYISRNELPSLRHFLRRELRLLITQGYNTFCAGGAMGFDTEAAEAVLELRAEYPYIQLILILPCKTQATSWPPAAVARYETIKQSCNRYIYVSVAYRDGCMHQRNRQLVDSSSLCLVYCTKTTGGTAYTINYANKQNIPVINLAQNRKAGEPHL